MTPAAILMKMQELDLALDRDEQTLRELPALKELARKRAAYQKLKSEEARLLGVRKDLEAEIEDLVAEQKATEDEVTITQEDAQRLKDYREVQALEVELSDLAKKLDKIAFSLTDKHRALAEAREREAKVSQYTQKFEESLIAEAQATKEAVTEVQERVASARREREACAANIDEGLLQRYTRLRARAPRHRRRSATRRYALRLPHEADRGLARRPRPRGGYRHVPVLWPSPASRGA